MCQEENLVDKNLGSPSFSNIHLEKKKKKKNLLFKWNACSRPQSIILIRFIRLRLRGIDAHERLMMYRLSFCSRFNDLINVFVD